ncbi:hypothetical protein [Bacillus thuringiensis]|uniref:hypothetical protein n=1 Tax=Bacillus thuringiensis TaxID=1428 RepID=UPI0011A8AAC3|nr:hypothetical protein [Bacillus thuringiensis]
MMQELFERVLRNNVGMKIKNTSFEGMRKSAINFGKLATEGDSPETLPNCGDYSLINIELGSEHGFENGASVQMDVFFDYTTGNNGLISYRVFIEVNGDITFDECISLELYNTEEIALDKFIKALDTMLKKDEVKIGEIVEFDYLDEQGYKSGHIVGKVRDLWFGSNNYFAEEQWLIEVATPINASYVMYGLKNITNLRIVTDVYKKIWK